MEYPDLVYKCPGDHQRPGGTFNYLQVKNEAELDTAIKDGWLVTLPDAINAKDNPTTKTAITLPCKKEEKTKLHINDDAPPTRAEILKACDDLNISYQKNTPSKKLLKLIDKQLE